MKSPILMTAVLALTTSNAYAQSNWTDFSSALYKSDIEKMEKTTGIVPDPSESIEDRFKTLNEFAISKLNYSPSLASTIPVQMISLEEKILGKYTPPDEDKIKAAMAASQPQQVPPQSTKQHKHGSLWNWISTGTMPTLGGPGCSAKPVYPYNPYATLPASFAPSGGNMITPYFINGGAGGMGTITTMPGGTIMINGTGLH